MRVCGGELTFLSLFCSQAMKSSAPGMTRCMWYSTPSMSITNPRMARMSHVRRPVPVLLPPITAPAEGGTEAAVE